MSFSLFLTPSCRSLPRLGGSSISRGALQSTSFSSRSLNSQPPPPSRRLPSSSPRGDVSFVFDIDGVLKKGEIVFEGAKRALALLDANQIPYLLCTNGGGMPEQDRCKALSEELEVNILANQLVQSHTPLRHLLVSKFADSPVLVIGGKDDHCRKVALSYGLTQPYTPLDLLRSLPSLWPFRTLVPSDLPFTILPPAPDSPDAKPFSNVAFKAIVVLHDSRDWGLDASVMSELIASEGGVLGTVRKEGEQEVEVYFCNPDLVWGSDYPLARYGAGAFKSSLLTIHKESTGQEIVSTQLGKPHKTTYDFVKVMLDSHRKGMGLGRVAKAGGEGGYKNVWMVGDNPASDIQGANINGLSSLLVSTGVFRPSSGVPPAHTPTKIVSDVEEGVEWVLRKEGVIA
ncbi:HAD-like domain-containing protein [Mrakia frigida]|uniref:uncharacterized protein n=1 Tax=Mrakia frigida TaxID=29902 RepID=UPI003FCBFFA5